VYLKRLELHGFKSFAAKTSFDFGQGLTAIVGPNGSGKSNIADALRWVLGEQSSKLIRAKRLDDVIYAGSEKRPRADRVEVTMVLDNSSGWLPVDHAEVSITRRGHRNGDSDYFLNGRRAKLREIQLIFATAAVSQNSYAIIGQGLVESILNLRPEDRRQLIEEAADIQRYRLKIEEAEMRLKQTRENVERVKLLIKEIAPRMTALERQAKRAGEHARLTVLLQQALREFYEHRWAHAQEAVTVARATHDQAQAEFIQARVALETVQRELSDITSRLDDFRQASAAAQADKDRLEAHVRDLERRLAVANERRNILTGRQKELNEELVAVEAERDRAHAVLGSGDDERVRLEQAVAEARKVAQERQSAVSALEAEFRESHLHAADAEAKSKRLQTVAAEMKARIRRLTDAGEQLERDTERYENRRRSIVHQMTEHLRVMKGLRTQDVQMLAEASQTSARREALEVEVQEWRESLAAVEANQNARRGKLEGLEARLQVLGDAQKQSEGGPDEAITIEGAVGTTYEMLRVPRGMEEAIAAVLADQIEAFVFERQADAVAAIESLVRQNGPRVTAIPLDAMKQVYPLSLMKEKGVLGVAAQLVKYPQKYEKLVNTLLGRVIVVQDVETAIRLLRRRLGTIVTADGIVFDQSGTISGGRGRGGKTFSLAYERDLESIPKEIYRIKKSIEITEEEADKLRQNLREAEGALGALARETDGLLDRRLHLQDTLSVRQQKLAQLRGEMRGLMSSMENVREQQGSYLQQAATLEAERSALLEESREAAETSKHLGKADDLFETRRRALAQASEEAADALGRVDAGLRSLTVQKENAQAALARVDAQASAKAVQLRGIEMEVSTLDDTVARDEKDLAEARVELETLLGTIQPDREGGHHLEARQGDLHKQVLSAQNRMFDAERRTLETEAEVRRWETEIENMRQRMMEDGLVLDADGSVRPEKAPPPPVEVPYWLAAEGDEGPGGGLRPMSGGALIDHEALGKEIEALRAQIRALGPVNVEATADYDSLKERHDFLSGQVGDLGMAEAALKRAIEQLTGLMKRKFLTTFAEVAGNFERNFKTFFGGGHAKLRLTDEKHPWETGVEIEARPPGKRTQSLAQLSGGEKSLASVALLFALLQANPAPFCVLDEVDAMLDEANVGRFAQAIKTQSQRTQFIVITHNRRTIEQADSIYGISMAPDAASRVLSMRLGDIPAAVMEN
jgi:chromosome segregation protein